MGKKFISVQCRVMVHKLFEKDIKKIYYAKTKNLPKAPTFYCDESDKIDENTPEIFIET
jgi:hypothetical protein